MKHLSILAILMMLASPSYSKPKLKTVIKKVVEYSIYAAPIATSLLATHEGSVCRAHNDVAVCSGGYGPFYAREYGVRMGLSVTMTGLAVYGHKNGFKEWFAPAVGMAAFNSYVIYDQAHAHSNNLMEK
jgi:hypothetical protein